MEPKGEKNYCCGGGGGTVSVDEIRPYRTRDRRASSRPSRSARTGAHYVVAPVRELQEAAPRGLRGPRARGRAGRRPARPPLQGDRPRRRGWAMDTWLSVGAGAASLVPGRSACSPWARCGSGRSPVGELRPRATAAPGTRRFPGAGSFAQEPRLDRAGERPPRGPASPTASPRSSSTPACCWCRSSSPATLRLIERGIGIALADAAGGRRPTRSRWPRWPASGCCSSYRLADRAARFLSGPQDCFLLVLCIAGVPERVPASRTPAANPLAVHRDVPRPPAERGADRWS